MTQCPECLWPDNLGHDRDCKRGGAIDRTYPPDAEQLPELCVPVFAGAPLDGLLGATGRVLHYRAPMVGLLDHVAIPLALFRRLLARAAGQPDPHGIEERLAALERGVALSAGVAAQAAAALERFVAAVEAERDRCLECKGEGEVAAELDGKPAACVTCHGTGRPL